MEKISWKIDGMDCTNCALSVNKFLQDKGMKEIRVNFIGGDVQFNKPETITKEELQKGIKQLGYTIVQEGEQPLPTTAPTTTFRFRLNSHGQRFLFCLPFTLVLMTHMLPIHIHWLMNPWIQLAICSPVYIVGMGYFGRSAINSIMRGIPNMNVLIAVGATAAFVYSLIGTLGNLGEDYLFYETAATIITLVFLGEFVEHRSIAMTQRSLNELARHQRVPATMIGFDDKYQENFFTVENTDLRVGDLILIRSGEQVPMDCRILSGEAQVSEALLTGESTPIQKGKKDNLIGGSLIIDGVIRAQVTAVGTDTVLSNILNLVKQAQAEKPPVQQLADKISAIFVPTVIGIALITFLVNYLWVDVGLTSSIMRSIAVLVISCPCAMGLATPAAIAVGLGRAAKNGILFRNARSLELFKDIRTVIFDKTGTLTEGRFRITRFDSGSMPEAEFKQLVVSIEKYSTHPIATAIVSEWNTASLQFFTQTEEQKGKGMQVQASDGTIYRLYSERWANSITKVPPGHQVYVLRNDELVGWLDLDDELRPEASEVIQYLHARGIRTILLSGDSPARCEALAKRIGITEVIAGQSPEQKLAHVSALTAQAPTAMVGDGINDAPALAKATIGISMSESTQLALQTAQVVLMKQGIKHLPLALGLGKHTFKTIQGNLFWAFCYNIVAIPIAAVGLLAPGIAALTMGLSDVVLAINSIRLNYKRVL